VVAASTSAAQALIRTIASRAERMGRASWAESAELDAVEPQSWQVRQTDYEFVISPEAQAIVQEEGIILVDYRAVQTLWNAKSRG
jgi:hypothetical protein